MPGNLDYKQLLMVYRRNMFCICVYIHIYVHVRVHIYVYTCTPLTYIFLSTYTIANVIRSNDYDYEFLRSFYDFL